MRWTIVVGILLSLLCAHSEAAVFNRIGGDGGDKQKTIACPQGQYAIAIRTYHDGNVINQVRLRCSPINPATGDRTGRANWTVRSPTDRIGGTNGLRSSTVQCPRNQFLAPVVKGHLGRFFLAEVVSGLRVRCVRYNAIDRQAGTSVRRVGGERRSGARFVGPQQTSAGQGRLRGDTAIHQFNVRYGHAVDAIRFKDLLMPWYQAPASQNLPPPRPISAGPATGSTGGSSGGTTSARPDLMANMRSVLWRYSGTTTHKGRSYRRVHSSFCASGMQRQRGSLVNVKNFTLPAVEFDVVNVGTGNAANANVEVRFGAAASNRSSGALASGARSRQRVERGSIRRCVTNGGVPGPCHECSGTTAYEDPQLQVTVDSNNAVSESDEGNNRLVR